MLGQLKDNNSILNIHAPFRQQTLKEIMQKTMAYQGYIKIY